MLALSYSAGYSFSEITQLVKITATKKRKRNTYKFAPKDSSCKLVEP